MATIIHKISETPDATPTTVQLSLGEIAVNSYDGKLFIKKNDGTESIVEIGGATRVVYEFDAAQDQDVFEVEYNDPDKVDVFINGSLLPPSFYLLKLGTILETEQVQSGAHIVVTVWI